MSTTATDAPSAASRRTVARPIPDAPPVTRATLFSSDSTLFLLSDMPSGIRRLPARRGGHRFVSRRRYPLRARPAAGPPGAGPPATLVLPLTAPPTAPDLVKPIPVSFNIWKLKIHTYGIGLAITFWFAFRYFERRLRDRGYPWQWLAGAFVWIIVAAIIGARAVHVLANLSYYDERSRADPGHLERRPVVVRRAHRRCPDRSDPRPQDDARLFRR